MAKPAPRRGASKADAAPRDAKSYGRQPPRRGGARTPRAVRAVGSVRAATRGLALDALVRVEDGAFANLDLPVRLRRSGFDARDKAWVTDAVYGTLRQRRRIDALVGQFISRPLQTLDPPVRNALRLGAFQLLNGVAAHAAVGETVAVAPEQARGFVNGALRAMARKGPPFDESKDRATRLSYPDWIVECLDQEFGAVETERALVAMNEPPAVTLRVNPMRPDSAAVESELEARGGTVTHGALVPDALVVRGIGDVGALRAMREGRVSPQDQGSQAIVALLDPQLGDRVLDVAAAPGGKSAAIAERCRDTGLVAACDLHRGRLTPLREAAGRLRLVGVHAINADGRNLPFAADSFDRVLLDAPCSGLGVLRRRPEARWRGDPEGVEALAQLQRELLASAARAVRPGGRLVYSVCTMTAAETTGVDDWAAHELTNFVALAPPPSPWRPRGRGALILPHDAGTDGMFVLVLQRDR
jgi:16S rRNA (cytosine967-C5)-methyltransferase